MKPLPLFPSNRWLLLALLAYTLLILLPSGAMPLVETTEARYAEIAREMIVTGNYLEPHYNAIKHFHKPPLAYWLVAAGFKIFGMNGFGARFFGVMAAALAVLYLYRTARLLLEKPSQALLVAGIFGSSLQFLVVSRLASTEIYLVTSVVAAQFYLFRQIYGERNPSNALLYGLCLGLGFFLKGPIIFLFTLVPFLLAKFVDPRHRRVFNMREVATAFGVFALVSLPWYVLVIHRNPELLAYFFKVQIVDRVVTDRFHRYEPPWYFLYIFVGTFFPFTLFFLKGLFRWKDLTRTLRVMLIYVVAPLLVFTLAKGKHATYILPFFGTCALITAGMLETDSMMGLRRFVMWLLLPLVLALAVLGFVYHPLEPVTGWLIAAGLLGLVLWWPVWRDRNRQQYWVWVTLLMVYISGVDLWGAGVTGPNLRGYRKMAMELNRRDPERRLETVVYRDFLPSLSFYRNRLTITALAGERETQFQPESSYRPWYLDEEKSVRAFLATHPELFVVTRDSKIKKFASTFHYQCEPVFIQHKSVAYYCRRLPASESPSTRNGPVGR